MTRPLKPVLRSATGSCILWIEQHGSNMLILHSLHLKKKGKEYRDQRNPFSETDRRILRSSAIEVSWWNRCWADCNLSIIVVLRWRRSLLVGSCKLEVGSGRVNDDDKISDRSRHRSLLFVPWPCSLNCFWFILLSIHLAHSLPINYP